MNKSDANHSHDMIHSVSLPWKSHFIKVKDSQMHYLDEGEGNVVLFIHGNPTSGYLWRNVFPFLSDRARCIVPDLIGMGKSGIPRLNYQFSDHYEYLEAFIEELGLENITLVVHDWGSALGFYYMRNHPGKIKKVAFMEALVKTWRWKSMKLTHRWGFRLLRAPLVGEAMIYFLNGFINFIMPRLILRQLTKEEKQAYKAPFKKIRNRKPMLVWLREIPISGNPKEMHKIVTSYSESLCRSDIPKLMIYGRPGAIINQKNVNWCKRHIRNLETMYIGEGLHFIQEDYPHAIGHALREWYLTADKK